MTWTIVERRGDIPPAKRGDEWGTVTTFEIMDGDSCHPVASLFACKDGWYEGAQRERAALVAAAPALLGALERILGGDNSEAAHAEAVRAVAVARGVEA